LLATPGAHQAAPGYTVNTLFQNLDDSSYGYVALVENLAGT